MSILKIGKDTIDTRSLPVLIAGPCALEDADDAVRIAEEVAKLADRLHFYYIFKGSYLKDNRSSVDSYTGPGLEEGLKTLARVKEEVQVPVLTDVHCREEVSPVAEVCDVLQIPAFLSRQTRLIMAAAATGRTVNIKKGQFLAPEDMKNVVEKAKRGGAGSIMLTERGSSFGYHNLVVDFTGFPRMSDLGAALILDVTHSLQLPGALGDRSGGRPELGRYLARAGAAVGVDGLFIETHFEPLGCRSDAEAMIKLSEMPKILEEAAKIFEIVRGF